MTSAVGLDFETYAATDLFKHGSDRYVRCEYFKPLIAAAVSTEESVDFDFVLRDFEKQRAALVDTLNAHDVIVTHSPFEDKVLRWMDIRPGIDVPDIIDSAVLSRMAGGSSGLDAAARQLIPNTGKLEMGRGLIELFSIPSKEQREQGQLAFDPQVVHDNRGKWADFHAYCRQDALLSYQFDQYHGASQTWFQEEMRRAAITEAMNSRGWPVDMDLVHNMQERYLRNLEEIEDAFRQRTGAHELNLNSTQQLKAWCLERGIKASSFSEDNVAKLHSQIDKRWKGLPMSDPRASQYTQVLDMLETKKALGGSSLKKLQTIIDTVSPDGRLRDQYLHIGAGQTFRTSGRGAQMQNMKRLNGDGDDMNELLDPEIHWSNDKMGSNIRQVFTSSHPEGRLIVGDLSSIESRGLAWQANESWKLYAYRNGQDVYKLLAAEMFKIDYDSVLKPQRQTGKVGELSCGYGAGGEAVLSFASGMGVEMTSAEASTLVSDWRASNMNIVSWWKALDNALHQAVDGNPSGLRMSANNWELHFRINPAPRSLAEAAKNLYLMSLTISIIDPEKRVVSERIFHGIYRRGRAICFWKPSSKKSGSGWSDTFPHPKTKRQTYYSIYGGKLAGILTQSICREIFMEIMVGVEEALETIPNAELIGQFHDELVINWVPSDHPDAWTCRAVENILKVRMSTLPPRFSRAGSFPMGAEVHSAYRYIK